MTTEREPPSTDPVESLRALGFRAPREALAALLTHAHQSHFGPSETIEQLVVIERRAREATNLARRTKAAALGAFKPIDRFDWNHPRKIDRALIERLLGLDFIERGDNVLLRGQSGVGKSMLAKAIGQAALERGYSVRFSTLAAALADLLQQESLTCGLPRKQAGLVHGQHPLAMLDRVRGDRGRPPRPGQRNAGWGDWKATS